MNIPFFKMKIFFAALILLLSGVTILVASCNILGGNRGDHFENATTASNSKKSDTILEVIVGPSEKSLVKNSQRQSEANDLARYLAALPPANQSRFLQISSDSSYKNYIKKIDSLWRDIEENSIKPIAAFRKRELTGKDSAAAFYPMSGADFVNFYQFYPNAKRYVMIGLEPPGVVRDPLQLSGKERVQSLNSLINLVSEISSRNYFTRKLMRETYKLPNFTGTQAVLLLFMSRMGLFIESVESVSLNINGEAVRIHPSEKISDKALKGIHIRFYREDDMQPSDFYYFKIFLNPDSGANTTPEGKFLNSLGGLDTFFKSAEYIMQQKSYEPFSEFVVQKSRRVVQDDSGIAFAKFNPNQWSVRLYGEYRYRVELPGTPHVPEQTLLANAFKSKSEPLPFKFGYGVLSGKNRSNLIYLERK